MEGHRERVQQGGEPGGGSFYRNLRGKTPVGCPLEKRRGKRRSGRVDDARGKTFARRDESRRTPRNLQHVKRRAHRRGGGSPLAGGRDTGNFFCMDKEGQSRGLGGGEIQMK